MIIKPKYKWRDEFMVPLAPGSINGAKQTPGPGLITTVNTETCMAIIPRVGTALATHTGVTFGGSNNRCCYDATGPLTAWADFPTGFNMSAYADQGLMLVMFDSAGVGAYCFLGGAGGGETLGADLLAGWDFTNGWSAVSATVIDANSFSTLGNGGMASTAFSFGLNRLIRFNFLGTTSSTSIMLINDTGYTVASIISAAFVENAFWSSIYNDRIYIRNVGAGTTDITTLEAKAVITPSQTGVYAYKDAAMTVSGWNKPTAFNMNSASYTFGIYEPQSRGRLFFMGGKSSPAEGDPGYWKTESVTRKRGLVCCWKVNNNDASKMFSVGLDNNKTTNINGTGIIFQGGFIKSLQSGSVEAVMTVNVAVTDTYLAIVLRDAGAHFYARIGTGQWKYLWSTTVNNTATLYAGISNYNAVGYCDWIRQSNYLWMPKPLISDSFAGADGSADGRVSNGLGHAEVSGLGSGGSGVVWSGASGSIVSNRLVITPELGEELLTNGNFSAWTGDNPDGFTVNEPAPSIITQDPVGQCYFNGDASAAASSYIHQAVLTSTSAWYFWSVDITDIIHNAGSLVQFHSTNYVYKTLNTVGTHILSSRRVNTNYAALLAVYKQNKFKVDNFSVKALTLATCFQTCQLPTKDVTLATRFVMIAGTQCGIVFGINGDNLGLLYHNGAGSLVLEIKESTTWTQKSIKTIAAVSDGELILRRDDNVIWAYYNNTLLDALTPTTTLSAGENTNLSGLTVGLFSTHSGNSFSSFTAQYTGSNGEIEILSRLIGN